MTAPGPIYRLAGERWAPHGALRLFVIMAEQGMLCPEWRRVKQLHLVTLTGLHESRVSRLLRWLVDAGHVERRTDPFFGYLYRLPERSA